MSLVTLRITPFTARCWPTAIALFLIVGSAAADTTDLGFLAYLRKDYGTALKEWGALARAEDPRGQYGLGILDERGHGVEQNYESAREWYQKAAAQGYGPASYALGRLYEQGLGGAIDYNEAIAWYQKAVEQYDGFGDAEHALGRMYAAGRGTVQNYSEARQWYFVAAEKGLPRSQEALGILYYNGLGVEQDHSEAAMWFRRAANAGKASAQRMLGVMAEFGQGIPQSYQEADHWYRKAAERGDAKAQFSLGFMCHFGKGREPNIVEAINWYSLAADQGEPSAKYYLASLYSKGEFVSKDVRRAAKLYREVVDLGAPLVRPGDFPLRLVQEARAMLCVMHYKGEGVPRDYFEAKRWCDEVVQRGALGEPATAVALTILGSLYDEGHGVPQDFIQAHMWYNLAATSGNPHAASLRDLLASQMTPEQIAMAQKSASNWQPETANPDEVHEQPPIANERPELVGTGTGFVVAARGVVLTNHHVVEGCHVVTARTQADEEQTLALLASDPANDLAILKLPSPHPHLARFRAGADPRLGEAVTVIGFPLQTILTSTTHVTAGLVSAVAGPGNDTRLMQLSAPIQPGNSGSPLLDSSGRIVGMIVGTLDAKELFERDGDVPQNVNFAIKGSVLKSFLGANEVTYQSSAAGIKSDSAAIAEEARKYTLSLSCWN